MTPRVKRRISPEGVAVFPESLESWQAHVNGLCFILTPQCSSLPRTTWRSDVFLDPGQTRSIPPLWTPITRSFSPSPYLVPLSTALADRKSSLLKFDRRPGSRHAKRPLYHDQGQTDKITIGPKDIALCPRLQSTIYRNNWVGVSVNFVPPSLIHPP